MPGQERAGGGNCSDSQQGVGNRVGNLEGASGVETDTEGGVRFGVGCGQQSVEEPLGGCGPLGLGLTARSGRERFEVDPYGRTVRGT